MILSSLGITASEQTDDQLQDEIQKAHVVCVIYSVEDDDSLDRITSYWLPFIRDASTADVRKPVVLVGNKVDLVDYSTIDVSCDFLVSNLSFLNTFN